MSKRRPWKDLNRIPSGMVPKELIADGLYGPGGGYLCRRCTFSTKKSGFPGRQALRAHLKLHRGQDRAWQRPLARQLLVSVVLVAGAVVLALTDVRLPEIFAKSPDLAELMSFLTKTTPLLAKIFALVPALVVVLLLSATALALPASVSPALYPTPGWARLLLAGRITATLLLGMAALWYLGFRVWPGHPVEPWLLMVLGLSGIWLAVARGLMLYALGRRMQRSEGYGELLKAKNESAMFSLMEWRRRRAEKAERIKRSRAASDRPFGVRPYQQGRRR